MTDRIALATAIENGGADAVSGIEELLLRIA